MRINALICGLIGASLMTGCASSSRDILGLDRAVPDEFTVMTRAPLTLPPIYDLRPPEPGAERPQDKQVLNEARSALLGADLSQMPASDDLPSSEAALLRKAGAENAPDDIRQKITFENTRLIENDKHVTDQLIFWKEKSDPTAVVIDAQKEDKRLKGNQALGRSVTEGDVPVIERRKKGFLEDLF